MRERGLEPPRLAALNPKNVPHYVMSLHVGKSRILLNEHQPRSGHSGLEWAPNGLCPALEINKNQPLYAAQGVLQQVMPCRDVRACVTGACSYWVAPTTILAEEAKFEDAGGVGINLTAASYVMFASRPASASIKGKVLLSGVSGVTVGLSEAR